MTAPRMPLFQRPGAPAMSGQPEGQPPEMEAGGEGLPPIQCEGCGAQIDPMSGEVIGEGGQPMGGEPSGDVSGQLEAMLGGG